MYDYIKYCKKVLHIGTKGKVNEPYKLVLLKLHDLKKFIEKTLPESTVFISPFLDFPVFISNLFTQADNGKASLTVIKTDEHSYSLQLDVIDNGNITSNELNIGGLHLDLRGLGKLTINCIRRIKKFAATWRANGSFLKATSFDSQINFRSVTSLGNIEK